LLPSTTNRLHISTSSIIQSLGPIHSFRPQITTTSLILPSTTFRPGITALILRSTWTFLNDILIHYLDPFLSTCVLECHPHPHSPFGDSGFFSFPLPYHQGRRIVGLDLI
jgi:hypothetical protein